MGNRDPRLGDISTDPIGWDFSIPRRKTLNLQEGIRLVMDTNPQSTRPDDEIDWSEVKDDVAKQIFTQGETYLKSQMQIALDADKRALGLAGFFTTFSTASFAVCVTYTNVNQNKALLASGIVAAALAFISAILSFYSARPMEIKVPGAHPRNYRKLVSRPVSVLYGLEAQNYQAHIDKNQDFLSANAKYVRIAIWIFASIPAVTAIIYYLLFFSEHPEKLREWACSVSALHRALACVP